MLSSGLRKVMKALLILLAAAWITTGANATSEGERAPGLADKRFVTLVLPEVNANTMDVRSLRRAPRAEHPRHRAARSSRMARREGARGVGGRSHPQHQKRAYSSSS